MDDEMLRSNLLELLNGGIAYPPVRSALAGLKPENRSMRPAGAVHSVWEELEHMRIAQEDILRYTLNPKWKSPTWPVGYWPDPKEKPTIAKWAATKKRFFADLNELKSMVRNRRLDLTARIPHGEGRTYLRQVLLAADHNAYHTGQVILVRRLLGDWPA
ncbi:MAG TPA: DinB family protein [Acidobacteriota bacterium]|nr:DinB family protein [Acidobacteriota bacterium]